MYPTSFYTLCPQVQITILNGIDGTYSLSSSFEIASRVTDFNPSKDSRNLLLLLQKRMKKFYSLVLKVCRKICKVHSKNEHKSDSVAIVATVR